MEDKIAIEVYAVDNKPGDKEWTTKLIDTVVINLKPFGPEVNRVEETKRQIGDWFYRYCDSYCDNSGYHPMMSVSQRPHDMPSVWRLEIVNHVFSASHMDQGLARMYEKYLNMAGVSRSDRKPHSFNDRQFYLLPEQEAAIGKDRMIAGVRHTAMPLSVLGAMGNLERLIKEQKEEEDYAEAIRQTHLSKKPAVLHTTEHTREYGRSIYGAGHWQTYGPGRHWRG